MFDDDRDPDDELFRRALQRVAGPELDAHSSLEAFAGVRRAAPRRSRAAGPRLAVLAAAAAVLLLLAAVNRRSTSGIHPAATTRTSAAPVTTAAKGMSSIIVTAPTEATAASTTSSTMASSAVTTEIVVDPGDGSAPSDTAVDATGSDAGVVGGAGGAGGATGNGGGRGPSSSVRTPTSAGGAVTTTPLAPVTTAAPASATTAVPAPRVFVVTGGRITVTVRNGAFGKPTVVTDAGWDADVRRADATRIEVRFKNDGNDRTARLTLLANGDVQVDQSNGG